MMFRFSVQAILVLLIFPGMVFSQGSTGRRIADPNYIVTRTASEAIVSINLNSSELVLKDWDGKSHTVKVNKDTKFSTGTATLRDLGEGQMIRITYRVKDSTALEIRSLAPAPKK